MPAEPTDSSPGISTPHHEPFGHCVAGIHIGPMTPSPVEGEFDSVLTVGKSPGFTPDLTRHRHIPISYTTLEVAAVVEAVDWVLTQIEADRKTLVRSEGGKQRPGLIVACAILRMDGSYVDALACVRHANPSALTDFRYLDVVRNLDRQFSAHRRRGQ